jgi:hypothetical protein
MSRRREIPTRQAVIADRYGRVRFRSNASMDFVHEPAGDGAIVFFVASNHRINLMRRPRRTSIVQGGTCDGDISDRDGVWLIESIRSGHVVRASCATRSV